MMSKSGLFAGKATQDAPTNGALTTKQRGYHWFEWDAVPDRTTAEFRDGIGYAATQNNYVSGAVDYPHPFVGQEFSEFTMSHVFKVSTPPSTFEEYSLTGLNGEGGIWAAESTGFFRLDATIWTIATGDVHRICHCPGVQMGVGDALDWDISDWYCITMSYSQSLNRAEVSYVNLNREQEIIQSMTVVDNVSVSYTYADTDKHTVAAWGFWETDQTGAPIKQPFIGTLGSTFVHNGYLDLWEEENRRKFSGIDGIINLGNVGQSPFGEQPLIYMPSGGPWDQRGTADTGTYPSDYYIAEPTEFDVNLPPIAT